MDRYLSVKLGVNPLDGFRENDVYGRTVGRTDTQSDRNKPLAGFNYNFPRILLLGCSRYSSERITSVLRSDLHLGTFEGIFVAFPVVPAYSLRPSCRSSCYVFPIKVTVVAALKPPGTSPSLGAVTAAPGILVSVLGREPLTIVLSCKAVTWNKRPRLP